jgi:hypothetical protein
LPNDPAPTPPELCTNGGRDCAACTGQTDNAHAVGHVGEPCQQQRGEGVGFAFTDEHAGPVVCDHVGEAGRVFIVGTERVRLRGVVVKLPCLAVHPAGHTGAAVVVG